MKAGNRLLLCTTASQVPGFFLTFFCTLVSGKHFLIYEKRRYALLFDECVIVGFGLVIPFLCSLFGIYHLPSPRSYRRKIRRVVA